MPVEFDKLQKAEVERLIERRLLRERRQHERELRQMSERHASELERLTLELRAERGLITRIREWLAR
jgi:hypothetical protein